MKRLDRLATGYIYNSRPIYNFYISSTSHCEEARRPFFLFYGTISDWKPLRFSPTNLHGMLGLKLLRRACNDGNGVRWGYQLPRRYGAWH